MPITPVELSEEVGCAHQTVLRFLRWRRGRTTGPGSGNRETLTDLEAAQFRVYWSLRQVRGDRSGKGEAALREDTLRWAAEAALGEMARVWGRYDTHEALWCLVRGQGGSWGAEAFWTHTEAASAAWAYLTEADGDGWCQLVPLGPS